MENKFSSVDGVNFWLPEDSEIGGNVHCRYPGSNQVRQNIHKRLGIVDALEPDYYTGGTILNVSNMHIAKMIQYELPTCVKCNGIVAKRSFLRENKLGMYGRSSDCLMLAIIAKEDIWMLHVSAEALNNGILLGLPHMEVAHAILGPCISMKNYSLTEEKAKERLNNYATLGYDKFCEVSSDNKVSVDIRQIAIHELEKRGITVGYNDTRCTFETSELGSHRRGNGKANPLYVWICE